jgi:small GTP-binding protein
MDNILKIVVMGSGGVGKSSMTVKYVQGIFVEKYDPTIEDSYRMQKRINDKFITMEILDTAGTEQFTSMRDLYMKNGEGFMLVYSITSRASYNELDSIYQHICQIKDRYSYPLILAGNKCDLEEDRTIEFEEAVERAQEWNCQMMEVSAKTGVNLNQAFDDLARMILAERKVNKPVKKRKKCIIL